MEENKKGSGFVVKDKRLFTESGEARPPEEQATPAAEEPKPVPPEAAQSGNEKEPDYPPINLPSFISEIFPIRKVAKLRRTCLPQNKLLISWICSMKKPKGISTKMKLI